MHRVPLLVLAILLISVQSSEAGNNATGSVSLSWDSTVMTPDRSSVPSGGCPLYVQLTEARDIVALAVTIRWYPFDSPGSCYRLASADSGSGCGWATAAPPGAQFNGDSSYTWTISFPEESTESQCVMYWVMGDSCPEPVPAVFLVEALTQDSAGQIDSLQVLNCATILGGAGVNVTVSDVRPTRLAADQSTVLTIDGERFVPGTRVSLWGPHTYIAATATTVADSTRLHAIVAPRPTSASVLSLLVQLPNGQTAQTASSLLVTSQAAEPAPTVWHRPSNDPSAFRKLDLYNDRIAAAYQSDHRDHSAYYPDSLISDSLLVEYSFRSDTMAIFSSRPNDCTVFSARDDFFSFQAWMRYAVTPPQYATSVGLLLQSENVYDGIGNFADDNEPDAELYVTYADGDSLRDTLRIGRHVRHRLPNLAAFCDGQDNPPYVRTPDDSLAAVVYSGLRDDGQGWSYMDAHEFALPRARWQSKVVARKLAHIPHADYCGSLYWLSTSSIYGLSLWPDFVVTDDDGERVPYQTQRLSDPNGGYVFNGDTVGTRRTLSANACQITCLSMLYNFYGIDCTPSLLNRYLREHNGYAREAIGRVASVSVTGDTVDFRGTACTSSDWKVGHTFVIERGPWDPIATVEIIWKPVSCGTERAKARVTVPHQPGIRITPGDTCWTYRYPLHGPAGKTFSGGTWRIRQLPTSLGAAAVESLLVRNIPLYVVSHSRSEGGHCVVVDGWRPAFVSGTSARGTYMLRDPAYDKERLIEWPFLNEFKYAFRLEPTTTQTVTAGEDVTVTSGESGLAIVINGAADVEIVDPSGRRTFVEPVSQQYVSEDDDVMAIRGWRDDDDEETSADDYSGQDVLYLSNAVEGAYTIRVVGMTDADVELTVNTTDENGVRGVAAVSDTTDTGAGGVYYRLTYTSETGEVALERLGVVGVGTEERRDCSLRVVQNPAFGPVWFEASGTGAASLVDIFDVSGRHVASLTLGGGGSGLRTAVWDDRGTRNGAGVYLARLRGAEGMRVVRFVRLH